MYTKEFLTNDITNFCSPQIKWIKGVGLFSVWILTAKFISFNIFDPAARSVKTCKKDIPDYKSCLKFAIEDSWLTFMKGKRIFSFFSHL